MRWSLLVMLTILPFEVAARYVDDYSEGGDGSGLLLILIPVCICGGYLLGAEARSFKQARAYAIGIAAMLGITALYVPAELLAALAGATALFGVVGRASRKPN
jgi:hypothetical protein